MNRERTPQFSQLTVCSGILNPVRNKKWRALSKTQLHLISNGVNGHRLTAAASRDPSSTTPLRLNLVLIFAVLAVMLGYIFASNFLVSKRYILGVRKQQFNQISAALQAANSELSGKRGMEDLLLFAQASGMIEAKDTGFIVEETGVALSGAQSSIESR